MMKPAALMILALAGCGGSSPTGPGACTASDYPCGPYGSAMGSVLADATLVGRRDLNHNNNPLDDAPATFRLADYHHDAAVKVLVLALSSVWCVPCRNEQPALIALHQQYQSQGVAFLEVLIQDQPGQAAGAAAVDAWATTYSVSFDIAGDPSLTLAPDYDPNSFPEQIVVHTADMKVAFRGVGAADNTLGSVIASALQ